MQFKKEIEQSLEQIQTLEECFRHARNLDILPISFFSTFYDIVRELTETLSGIEQKQLKWMQEQYIAGDVFSLETPEVTSNNSLKEALKDSFFPENFEEEQEVVPMHEDVKILADTRKYMSLNDKFRFQREIFAGSAEEMNDVFDKLNEFSTIEDALSFIENQVWCNELEIVTEFKELIEKRFS